MEAKSQKRMRIFAIIMTIIFIPIFIAITLTWWLAGLPLLLLIPFMLFFHYMTKISTNYDELTRLSQTAPT